MVPIFVEQLELEFVWNAIALLLHWKTWFAHRLETTRTKTTTPLSVNDIIW
jgi:hypothetical protein